MVSCAPVFLTGWRRGTGWVRFLFVSYILGHFIFALGSLLLDDLYDQSYRKCFENEAKELLPAAETT